MADAKLMVPPGGIGDGAAHALGWHGNTSYIKLLAIGARWIDPALARWLSPDTIVPDPANPQSLNRYSWVLNRPLVFDDPSGHSPPLILVTMLLYLLMLPGDSGPYEPPPQSDAAARFVLRLNDPVDILATAIEYARGDAGPEDLVLAAAPIVVSGGAADDLAKFVCPSCGKAASEMDILRSQGKISDKVHVKDLEHIGEDGVSAFCFTCVEGKTQGAFWGRSPEEIRAFSERVGLDPEKALVYTPQFGGSGHYSLFIDAIGPDGKLLPEYAALIDEFLRTGEKFNLKLPDAVPNLPP